MKAMSPLLAAPQIDMPTGAVLRCRALHPPADAVDQVRSRERAALEIAILALRRLSDWNRAGGREAADSVNRALDRIAEILYPPH